MTIVENESYLAQSIASKLNAIGYQTEIFNSVDAAMQESFGDIYLISSNIPGQSITPLIFKFKSKVIILMVNYSNNDLIAKALRSGANDYIVKPFMIDELQKKIEHYAEYAALKQSIETYKEYHEYCLRNIYMGDKVNKIDPPMVIETNYITLIDKLVFAYAQKVGKLLAFIPLKSKNWKEKIAQTSPEQILYISNLQTLAKNEREKLLKLVDDKKFIISTTNPVETKHKTLNIQTNDKLFDGNEVLSIDEYIIFVIKQYQKQFPDTVLSKKLGFSRKSLWERRKKYGIFRDKTNK
ncbi:MAG: hypothetical protein K0U38_05370 [Epsilonproteobacteria bacterium]|nr:hypothetical protein [Campylobacterota bacterium]